MEEGGSEARKYCAVTRMDRWMKEEVGHRVIVRVKMTDIVVQKVLKWVGHVEVCMENG